MAPKTRSASKKQSGEAKDSLKETGSSTKVGRKRKQKADTQKDPAVTQELEVKDTGRKGKQKDDTRNEPSVTSEVTKSKAGRKRKQKAEETTAFQEEEPEMEEERTSPKKTKEDSQEDLTAVQEPSLPMETKDSTADDKQQSESANNEGVIGDGSGDRKGESEGVIGDGSGDEKGDSDNEAPEDIPLAQGKEAALEQRKDEVLQAQRSQQEARERRHRKNEQFKVQKEAKRMKQLSRFPDEALKEIARITAKEKEAKRKQAAKQRRQKKSGSKTAIPVEARDERFTVVALSETPDQVSPSYEIACDFLQQHLYGNRHKRVPVLSFLARRYKNKPAKNF